MSRLRAPTHLSRSIDASMGFPGVTLGARMDSGHEKELLLSCSGP